jgi:hypothetical protein
MKRRLVAMPAVFTLIAIAIITLTSITPAAVQADAAPFVITDMETVSEAPQEQLVCSASHAAPASLVIQQEVQAVALDETTLQEGELLRSPDAAICCYRRLLGCDCCYCYYRTTCFYC